MTKRGRPAHPDILTPREWEVLEHLREGRSNDEIAGRLGISVNGVKFHVTEILSKLNLENRTDAARWAESDVSEQRPWWTAAAAPLLFWRKVSFGWLPPVLAGGLAVGVAAGIGVLVWALVVTRGDGGESLTADEFTARFREALARDGQVLHTWVEHVAVFPDGETSTWLTVEAWLDAKSGVSRQEMIRDPSFEGDVAEYALSVATEDALYVSDGENAREQTPAACAGKTPFPGIFLSGLFRCDGPDDRGPLSPPPTDGEALDPPRIEVDIEYQGTPAIALIQEVTSVSEEPEGPEITEMTSTFYVNRDTFLPLALVHDGRSPAGERRGEVIFSFENEFVSADSLPADFFDPASIGYVEPTPISPDPTRP